MTPKEAAAILRVKRKTVYALIRSGELPSVKFGRQWRIPESALSGNGKRYRAS